MEQTDPAYVMKLLQMREWIDKNFPDFYGPYEKKFFDKAEEIGLDPHTLHALKREFELRFGVSQLEWQYIFLLLSFSAMRQAGVKSRYTKLRDGLRKEIVVRAGTLHEHHQPLIDRFIALLWDTIEKQQEY
ncbi:hypothetical protein JXA85_08125 [Candidatus Woesearchaeota archaeon]|nr:hypothetical protein [Candidatus Woesearchaeota archaeon]